MNTYTFVARIGERILARSEYDLADDLDALDLAQAMSGLSAVDVWEGKRYVAHVKRGDAPATIQDSVSG